MHQHRDMTCQLGLFGIVPNHDLDVMVLNQTSASLSSRIFAAGRTAPRETGRRARMLAAESGLSRLDRLVGRLDAAVKP